jgi:arylsulfate sulfotransferase
MQSICYLKMGKKGELDMKHIWDFEKARKTMAAVTMIAFIGGGMALVPPQVANAAFPDKETWVYAKDKLTSGEAQQIEAFAKEVVADQAQKEAAMKAEFEAGDYSLADPYVVVDPYDAAPLSALVMFKTDKDTWADIYVHAKEGSKHERYCSIKYDFREDLGKTHALPIYGLYDGDTRVTITLHEISGKVIGSQDITIHTDPSAAGYVNNNTIVTGAREAEGAYGSGNISELTQNDIDQMRLMEPYSGALTNLCPVPAKDHSKDYIIGVDLDGDARMLFQNIYAGPSGIRVDNVTDQRVNQITGKGTNHFLATLSGQATGLPILTQGGMVEYDPLGKVYNIWLGVGEHHDYVYNPITGNYILDINRITGSTNDYLTEVDYNTGEVVRDWDLHDSIQMTEYKPVASAGGGNNWAHINAVSMYRDPKTGQVEDAVLLSLYNQSGIFCLDLETNEIKWFISSPGKDVNTYTDEFAKKGLTPVMEVDGKDVPVEQWWKSVSGHDSINWDDPSDPYYSESPKYTKNHKIPFIFSATHAVNAMPNGDIYAFDNGRGRSKDAAKSNQDGPNYDVNFSRAVRYHVDEDAHTVKQVWDFGQQFGSAYEAGYISDVDYYDDNHWLIDFGGVGGGFTSGGGNAACAYVTEVKDDKVIYTLKYDGANVYRAERVTPYQAGDREVKLGQVQGNVRGQALAGTPLLSSISLDKTDITMDDGEEVALKAAVMDNWNDYSVNKNTQVIGMAGKPATNLVWKSSDESVATVDANGRVTGVSQGTAVITASVEGGDNNPSASCNVKVNKFNYSDAIIMNVGSNEYTVNGSAKNMDAIPYINSDSRTLVPVRFVSEALGCQVDWNDTERSVTIAKAGTVIKMTIGSQVYSINGQEKTMDTVPVIANDRTMVPVRFVSEALGAQVHYQNGKITIRK